MRLRGANLSMSEDGRNVDSALFSGTHPSVFVTGAQQTGLATETMYVVATMDALRGMGQAMFTVERPDPSTSSFRLALIFADVEPVVERKKEEVNYDRLQWWGHRNQCRLSANRTHEAGA
jgi:hypothetical protein